MTKITNIFVTVIVLLSINYAQSCLRLWNNNCQSDVDCCGATTWCDTNGGEWASGVCKPGGKKIVSSLRRKGSKLSEKTCYDLNEVCQSDYDCCGETTYCDDSDDYSVNGGICRNSLDDDNRKVVANKKSQKSSPKTCLGVWSNHCTSSYDCCGATTWCDTRGGAWAYGVCKPGGKKINADLVRKNSKLSVEKCRLVNDEGCQSDYDCCGETVFCDKNDPQHVEGICKVYLENVENVENVNNKKSEKSSVKTCLGLWNNHCRSSYDCCGATTWCDTNGGEWASGVCKPGGKKIVKSEIAKSENLESKKTNKSNEKTESGSKKV